MLHTNKNLYLVTFLLFMILVASVGTFLAYGASSSPSTFLKGSTPYGVSYEDWMTKWWQWNMQIPKEQHPQAANPDLTKCTIGQSGNVVFLNPWSAGKITVYLYHSGWACYNDTYLDRGMHIR